MTTGHRLPLSPVSHRRLDRSFPRDIAAAAGLGYLNGIRFTHIPAEELAAELAAACRRHQVLVIARQSRERFPERLYL